MSTSRWAELAPSPYLRSITRTSEHCEVLVRLDDLMGERDHVARLRSSAMTARLAASVVDGPSLVNDLRMYAARGVLPALHAVESLVEIRHAAADQALSELLDHPHPLVRRHASWRLGDRPADPLTYRPMVDRLPLGGIDTMHAVRALRAWADTDPRNVADAIMDALVVVGDVAGRARLTDALGQIPAPSVVPMLSHLAIDTDEALAVRCAAVGALGEHPHPLVTAILTRLLDDRDDELATRAALALADHTALDPRLPMHHRRNGVRIAQLVLAGRLDGQLSAGGRGDTGGVASLLVSLGEALARRDDVDHVLTIGRGATADALTGPLSPGSTDLGYAMIPFGDVARPATAPDDIWEHLPSIERGVRRALAQGAPTDVLHLRMADAGSLAGAAVARRLGIPVTFSLAPDPHNVVRSLQSRGELDDERFVRLDLEQHIWFRARMVEDLARTSERLALFPRKDATEILDDLDVTSDDRPRAIAEVAEGIDIAVVRSVESARDRPIVDELVSVIPEHRRGLPLVVSVGRLHPVKGMERVVDAWASSEVLRRGFNLVVVGGDLVEPSPGERSVLDQIDRIVPLASAANEGLVMLGGRPKADVVAVLVAAAQGRTGGWAGGGVYVDGALKEEFGLAVLEAMASGLVVVAPSTGGPSSYVDDGRTGVLVDPADRLAPAIERAARLAFAPGRARDARAMVEERYSIDTMAAQLTDLYRVELTVR